MEGMPEDSPPVPFADRDLLFCCAPEDTLQIRPFGRKFRQHNAAVPGIVRDKRTNIEVGIVRAPIVHEFDSGANAVDVWLDHFGGARRARGLDARFEPDIDFKFTAQPPPTRTANPA